MASYETKGVRQLLSEDIDPRMQEMIDKGYAAPPAPPGEVVGGRPVEEVATDAAAQSVNNASKAAGDKLLAYSTGAKDFFTPERLIDVPAIRKHWYFPSSYGSAGHSASYGNFRSELATRDPVENMLSKTELANDFVASGESGSSSGGTSRAYFQIKSEPIYHNRLTYLYTMAHSQDIKDYIRMMKLYLSAGISFKKALPWQKITSTGEYAPDGIGRWPDAVIVRGGGAWQPGTGRHWWMITAPDDITPLWSPYTVTGKQGMWPANLKESEIPLRNEAARLNDLTVYRTLITNFYVVASMFFYEQISRILDAAKQTDITIVNTLLAGYANTVLEPIMGMLEGEEIIRINTYACEDSSLWERADKGDQTVIPPGSSSLGTRTVRGKIPDTLDHDCVYVWHFGTFKISPITNPAGKTIVPGLDVKDGDVMTFRQAMRCITRLAYMFVYPNLIKLAARSVELSDPTATVRASAAAIDPFENWTLLYTGKSTETGQPLFLDVGQSLAKRSALQQLVIAPAGTPTASQYDRAPAQVSDYYRSLVTSEGMPISQQEKNAMAGGKGSSMLMWVLGGLAAGLIAMQVM